MMSSSTRDRNVGSHSERFRRRTLGGMGPTPSQEPFEPHVLARRGSPIDLCEQFVLSRSIEAPEGWSTVTLGAWTLGHHPTLPVMSIVDESGVQVGWLLGYPITTDGDLVTSGERIKLLTGVEPAGFVDDLGGRFLAVFVNTITPSVYPDACGTYSSVYCPALEMAASTPGLIPYDTTTRDRKDLITDLGIPWSNSMYPVGLTPRHGIHRLLPHHHLDLDRWVMNRHGPNWRSRGTTTVDEAAEAVAQITKRNIGAILKHFSCYLPLTAGHDSRTLLSCAREWASDLELYTLDFPSLLGENDSHVAAEIARRFGLTHRRVPMRSARHEDLETWMYRVSCSVGELRGWQATTSYRTLDPNRVRLGGNIGDLSRSSSVYWTPEDHADDIVTPRRLVPCAVANVRHFAQVTPGQEAASASRVVLEHLEHWIENAGTTDALQLLDMFYIENRIGAWGGVFPYAEYYGPGFTIFPMCHREIVAQMASLPEQTRREETFNRDVIAREWPDLLEWPFNTPSTRVRMSQLPSRAGRWANRIRSHWGPSA